MDGWKQDIINREPGRTFSEQDEADLVAWMAEEERTAEPTDAGVRLASPEDIAAAMVQHELERGEAKGKIGMTVRLMESEIAALRRDLDHARGRAYDLAAETRSLHHQLANRQALMEVERKANSRRIDAVDRSLSRHRKVCWWSVWYSAIVTLAAILGWLR